MTNPVYVAIDTADLSVALDLAQQAQGLAGGVKLGLEFFNHNGREGVSRVAKTGVPIFLDLKLHDIPNTVAKAVRALAPLAPSVLTVHASGGRAMMEAAKAAASPATKVVGVTVLTSLDGDDLLGIGVDDSPDAQVRRLADLARQSGLDGIVCSGQEVAAVREGWGDGFFVVPGIRPEAGDLGDQKRVMTPRSALEAGASILVIGRPITGDAEPRRALRDILDSLMVDKAGAAA